MHFSLSEIIRYSDSVERQCGRQGVPAILFFNEKWEDNEKRITICHSNLMREKNQKNLECYAQAIHTAGKFLRAKGLISVKKLEFLSEHLCTLDQEARSLLPQATLTFPKPVNSSNESQIAQQFEKLKEHFLSKLKGLTEQTEEELAPTPSTQAFLRSEEFLALKNYRDNVLKNDRRDHTFFGIDFTVQKKYDALNLVIEAFEQQKTMAGIENVMRSFYNTKNMSTASAKSIYDYLNTGQNLFTWFFGFLGLKKTTTVNLIDALNVRMELIQNQNEHELSGLFV